MATWLILDKFKALYRLPLCEAVDILLNKLHARRTTDLERLAHRSRLNPQAPYNRLHRNQAALARDRGWKPLDFAGARVLEAGCGPLLGYLPLAVFCGAGRCAAIEPSYNPTVLKHPVLRKKYFLPLWQDLSLLFGPCMEFAPFLDALAAADVQATSIEKAALPPGFDIVLSNSCLEHVFPLEESLRRLAELGGAGTRFLHLVNFTNHLKTAYPLKGMYRAEPAVYFRSNGKSVNLARASDVARLLAEAGLPAAMTVLSSYTDPLPEPPSPWWTERYGEDTLRIEVAIFTNA